MHLYGDAQTVGPVQPIPPHWPHSDCVAVAAELVVVPVVVALEVVVVLRVVDAALEVLEGTVVPAAEASRLWTVLYAGLVVRFAQYRHASPWPEKVLGIQEYASSKSLEGGGGARARKSARRSVALG